MEGKAMKVIAHGVLELGPRLVECFVFEDGRRALGTSQVQALVGAAQNRNFEERFAKILLENGAPKQPEKGLKNAIKRLDSKAKGGAPKLQAIEFRHPTGNRTAYAYDTDAVLLILQTYAAAFRSGKLRKNQEHLGAAATDVLLACAGTGLVALVDEATGFQATRAPDYLQQRMALYLLDNPSKWRRFFAEDLSATICRLYGKPIVAANGARWLAGVWSQLYKMVLGEDVYAELKRRNPEPQHGSNHTQHLTDPAKGVLTKDLEIVHAIAKTSQSRDEFWNRLAVQYRGAPLQLRWP